MAQTNVIPLKPKYARKLVDEGETLEVLRMRMYDFDHEMLADEVGVSVSCIYAIRSGRTKWPRPRTFFGLLKVLDLEMHLIPRGYNRR